MKKQAKTPGKNPNTIEMSNLPDEEFQNNGRKEANWTW